MEESTSFDDSYETFQRELPVHKIPDGFRFQPIRDDIKIPYYAEKNAFFTFATAKRMAKRVALSGAAIIGGALTGNPVAVIAGVASLADIGIQAKIAQDNINIVRQVEGVGLEMANIRAGANGGRSGKS